MGTFETLNKALILSVDYNKKEIEAINALSIFLKNECLLINQNEINELLDHTDTIIEYNNSNYTAWYCRTLLIPDNEVHILAEIEYVRNNLRNDIKSYSCWNHLLIMIERYLLLCTELDKIKFVNEQIEKIDEIIQLDMRNINAWQLKQCLILRMESKNDFFQKEYVKYKDDSSKDIRNNSIYTYKIWLLKNLDDENLMEEAKSISECLNLFKDQCLSESYLIYVKSFMELLESKQKISKKLNLYQNNLVQAIKKYIMNLPTDGQNEFSKLLNLWDLSTYTEIEPIFVDKLAVKLKEKYNFDVNQIKYI